MSKLKFIIFSFAAVLFTATGFYGQQSTPKAAAISFYKFDRMQSQIFNLKNIDARKRWFSDELYQLFLKELKRESEYLKANPTDKPHFGDGLPFRPLEEVCEVGGKSYKRTISYGRVTIKGEVGNVDVYFKYPKACSIPDILYALNMEKEDRRWVISDIRYFTGDTSLVEDLNRREY